MQAARNANEDTINDANGEAPRVLRHIFANNPIKSPKHNSICQAATWRRFASALTRVLEQLDRQPSLMFGIDCDLVMHQTDGWKYGLGNLERKSHSPGQCATVDSVDRMLHQPPQKKLNK